MNSLSNIYFDTILLYVVIISLCVGSFLNVAILRGLSGEDIVFLPSKCPKCNNKLAWYMNIPLISYIFLKGKCAFCKEHISLQYPIVEALTALLFTCCFIKYGFSLDFAFSCIALALFIVMATTDIKKTVIIDTHAYILALVGLIYSCFPFSWIVLIKSALGGIFGYLFFEIISYFSKKIINYRAFGEGDSLIALGLGTFFGLKAMLVIIPLAFLIQFILAIPILIKEAIKKNNKTLALSYFIITAGVFGLIYLNLINLANKNNTLYLTLALLISIFLLFALKILIKEIATKVKENNQEKVEDELETSFFTFPFGPALLLSAALCIFYLDNIKQLVKVFFNSF